MSGRSDDRTIEVPITVPWSIPVRLCKRARVLRRTHRVSTTLRRLSLLLLALAVLAAFGAAPPEATRRRVPPRTAARTTRPDPVAPDDCQRALHVLNRLGFGPRPGDLERIQAMGIDAYIASQLDPDRLPDPAGVAALDGLATLRMDEASLLLEFDRPERDARRFLEKSTAAAMAGPAPSSPGPVMTAAAGAATTAEDAARVLNAKIQEIVTPARRPQRVLEELTEARVLRAMLSDRQLEEVLVDFWMNHFNVFAGKDADRVLISSFENETIRPRVWGCFRDLLLATARSPAMLLYLDQVQSVADAEHRPGGVSPATEPARNAAPSPGLNENYARELMELHTLGVDGGYTQLDVTELARLLTGWSSAPTEESGGFLFRSKLHDVCAKTLLGHPFPAGGYLAEGEAAIDLLAKQPATAHHLALELCRRFVADEPPAGLVERVAARFLTTDGDLRETVRAIVTSPEFFDPRFYRAKVKSPFEYVISALRATGATAEAAGASAIASRISRAGEPLYLCAPPTGYPERGDDWVSSGALLARFNFALDLAGGRVGGAKIDIARLLPPAARNDARRAVPALEAAFLGGDVSEATRRQIEECVLEPENLSADGDRSRIALAAGMLLGGPEFQRR